MFLPSLYAVLGPPCTCLAIPNATPFPDGLVGAVRRLILKPHVPKKGNMNLSKYLAQCDAICSMGGAGVASCDVDSDTGVAAWFKYPKP